MASRPVPPIQSPGQASSVVSAIADCDAYIAKEQLRSADLRPRSVTELLDFYVAHRANLVARLDEYNSSLAGVGQ